jgi:UDP-N-acetylglucosamine/UDP-N-acetylgalactosamine diphosphorylase
MQREEILSLLKEYGQHHILRHYHGLSPEKKKSFLRVLKGLDLKLVFDLHKKFSLESGIGRPFQDISPAPIVNIPRARAEIAARGEARQLGESLIRGNQVAILIVAGGQGSRLGFEGPKGKFPITPVKKKSLFQLFAEAVKALSLRYQGLLPLLIMTSRENRQETQQFFESHNFFGLNGDAVYFFEQEMLPTLTPEGQLILRDDTHLLVNPDGHGGSLKAFYKSGLLENLTQKGFTELFYCQVDNPLVRIADPVFIGHHKREGAEISTKIVRRRDPEEKVGIYGTVNGRPTIVEYSDFHPEEYRALDGQGNIRHWAGNIAVHMISLPFIRRLNLHGFALPYHRSVKDVEAPGPGGRGTTIQTWKFETFVFDSIPFASQTCCLEVTREEEFSPVKNQKGNDSPDTARAAMNNLHRSWLLEAGAVLVPEAQVEISPLYALDKEELIRKLKGKKLLIRKDRYFE